MITALNYIAEWWTRTVSPDLPSANPKLAAESILAMFLSAPDHIKLELAGLLNPWRAGPAPEDADTEVTIDGRWWRYLLPGAQPSEDKPK